MTAKTLKIRDSEKELSVDDVVETIDSHLRMRVKQFHGRMRRSSDKKDKKTAYRLFSATLEALLESIQKLPGDNAISEAEGAKLMALFAERTLELSLDRNPREGILSKKDLVKFRGKSAFQEMLYEHGTLLTKEVATFLGISEGAVRKRFERGTLIAVHVGNTLRFPAWQFDEAGVVEQLNEVKSLLSSQAPVSVIQFFMTRFPEIEDTPINALKSGEPEKLELVKLLARQWRQQIAR